jgi:Carboxypeptidase regulatory-like domain
MRYVLALALILLAGCFESALAQNPTFALEGMVVDAQQAVLPGASVTIHNVSTGLTRTVTTDLNGRFVARALPPEGVYRVQVELAGFASEVRENLRFSAGQNVVLNFSLKLSTVQETITVSGDAPTVQTTSSEVSSTIDQTSFEKLPVKERNYFRLLTLDSNVVAAGTRNG